MPQVRPGVNIEFVFHSDYIRDDIRVMRSMVYDVIGPKVLLSEPSSGLLRSDLNRDILVTYMVSKELRKTRYGFKARIVDLGVPYETASQGRVPAVVIKQLNVPEPFDLRSFFRLRVPSSCGLELYLGGQKVTLIDISIGGAQITHAALRSLKPKERTNVSLRVDGRTYHLGAEVLRVWSPGTWSISHHLPFGTIKFVNLGKDAEQALGRKIFMIEQKMLAEGRR